ADNGNHTTPPPPSPPGSQRAMSITLRQFRITRGVVTLDDRQSNLAIAVKGLDESLSGDFAKPALVVATQTHADSVSATVAGIPYLKNVSLDLAANVNADLRTH